MSRFAALLPLSLAVAIAVVSAFGQTKQMKPKSKGEETAIRAMLSAQDPDSRIKAADDLITKYSDTDYKAYALYIEADSYSQKNDPDKAIVYGEQALEADPHNYQAAVLVSKMYAAITHANDLDRADKIAKMEKYGHQALDDLATAQKPNASLPDDQWMQAKNDEMGQAYLALGIAAAYSGKTDDANADFQKVADMDSDPTDLIRAGRALLDAKKPDAAIQWFDKAANAPNAPAQIKQIAQNDKARAQAMIKK
jgi:tetratricopeptide (TPR) repeat protein